MTMPSASIANELGRLLTEKKLYLTTAESCTGGQIASALCAAKDTPSFYGSGFVTFTDEAKITTLGVKKKTIDTHTAVSQHTVIEMTAGALAHSGADVAIAVSGYAGPDGGEDGTSAGTIWFAWELPGSEAYTQCKKFEGDSEAVLLQAANYAMAGAIMLLEESKA